MMPEELRRLAEEAGFDEQMMAVLEMELLENAAWACSAACCPHYVTEVIAGIGFCDQHALMLLTVQRSHAR